MVRHTSMVTGTKPRIHSATGAILIGAHIETYATQIDTDRSTRMVRHMDTPLPVTVRHPEDIMSCTGIHHSDTRQHQAPDTHSDTHLPPKYIETEIGVTSDRLYPVMELRDPETLEKDLHNHTQPHVCP